MIPSDADQKPTQVLREEHQVILRVIGVLDKLVARSRRGDGFEADAFTQCVTFFKLFADACHHAKEEDLLFPVLEASGIPREGGPIGVMLYEHRLGRQYTAQMAEALKAFEAGDQSGVERFHDAAGQYSQLLTNHIFKEDNILFNMGDRVMPPGAQATLCTQFCEVGCRSFDGRRKEELARIADDLERRWSQCRDAENVS